MEQTSYDSRLIRNHIVWSAVFAIVMSGGVYYLFCSAGPAKQSLHIDLSFLILPFIGYFLLRLASRIAGVLTAPRSGTVIAYILNDIAFSFFCYLFFNRAILLTHISSLTPFQTILLDLPQVVPYSLLFIAGYTLARLSRLLDTTSFEEAIAPAVRFIGHALIGFSLWKTLSIFTNYWQPLNDIGLIILAGMLAVAISNLGFYGTILRKPLLVDIGNWITASPAAKFILGALIASYIVFFRPYLYTLSSYAFLLEWAIICFIGWRILIGIDKSLEKKQTGPILESETHKHIQEIDFLLDEDFNRILAYQEDFIDNGSRKDLLFYLKQSLLANGFNGDEVAQKMKPIIEYNEAKIPWYIRGFWRKRRLVKNRMNRLLVFDQTMQELKLIVNPAIHKR